MRNGLVMVLVIVMLVAVGLSACSPEAAPPSGDNGSGDSSPDEGDGGGVPQAPEAEVIKWIAQGPYPSGSLQFEKTEYFVQMVEEMSGGRLVIDNVPPGTVVPAVTELDAVHKGTLDCSVSSGGYYIGQLGNAVDFFIHIPGGPGPNELMVWLYSGGGLELWRNLYRDFDVYLVGPVIPTPAELFCHSNVLIESLDDFRGLKFRTAGIWGNLLEKFGAAVVMLPGGEIYESMQRGVIDAFEYCDPAMNWSMGFQEVADYVIGPGIHAPWAMSDFMVNEQRWNTLPPDLKAIVEYATQAAALQSLADIDILDAEAMKKFEDYGNTVIFLSEDIQVEIAREAAKMYDEMAAEDPVFAEILQANRDFFTAYYEYKDVVQPKVHMYSEP